MVLENINLRILKTTDLTRDYLMWLSDFDVTKFSNNQYKKATFKSQLNYIKSFKNNKTKYLYGIFLKKKHIGNLVLGPIDKNHKRSEITYMIGDKNYWGLGIGSHVISKIVTIAKKKFNLKKLYASCASKNYGSQKVLIKNKFVLEGKRKKHLFYNGKWFDCFDYGLLL